MKFLSKIVFFLTVSFACVAQDIVDYHAIVQPYVAIWQDESISKLSTQEIIILTDVILLSYQVVQSSIIMSQARLTIQTELFKIVTLSINDTFDVRIQAQNNDLTNIKTAVTTIEDAQEKIKFACNTLKDFGPLIININPTVIQHFISNLKAVILNWGKSQHQTVFDLELIEKELVIDPHFFSTIKDVLEDKNSTEHNQLSQGANSVTSMYKKIENTIANLTAIRKESSLNFSQVLTIFFKSHYEALYNQLSEIDNDTINLIATSDNKLPNPEQIFIV